VAFLLGVLVLFAGMGVGIPAFHQIVFPLFVVIPRFRRPSNLTWTEGVLLILPLLIVPLKGLALVGGATTLLFVLLPAYGIVYSSGLLIALTTVLIELPDEESARKILEQDSVKELFTQAKPNGDLRYSSYTPLQMRLIRWDAGPIEIASYKDLPWECSVCYEENPLSGEEVCMKGNGRRFVVRCAKCGSHSVIRVSGIFEYTLLTEAHFHDSRGKTGSPRSPG